MKLFNIKKSGNMVKIELDKGIIDIRPWNNNIFRVTCRLDDSADTPSPLEIGKPPADAELITEENEYCVKVYAGSLGITISKEDGYITWLSADGTAILSQPFPELTRTQVVKYAKTETAGSARTVKTADGERSFVDCLQPYDDRIAYRSKVFFDWQENEILHGLGQAEEGIYNLRGNIQYLYPHNMRIPIPFLVSNAGYGVLFDCGCLMTFNDDARGSYIFLDTVDVLDFYFIQSEHLDGLIAGFRQLTGRASALPKWAFGYIQSREAYKNQEELVETAKEYRRRKIPLDCIVQDWNTWEEGKWGNKRLDKNRYPDIAKANDELHLINVHSMVSVWPNLSQSCEDYQEMLEAGFLLNDNSTYDAFNKEARELYWKQADRELFSGGFDSWWCDSAEPFSAPDWNGETLREPWERYNIVGAEHKKFLDPASACLYGLFHAKGMYENQRLKTSEKRVVNLIRSGNAGSQKYGAVLWSGDITAKWSTLKNQIAEGLNICMSGIPWWTLDIGGFFVLREEWQKRGCGQNRNPEKLWFWCGDFEDGADDYGYRELYVRWMQLGAFLPIFRAHGTDTQREIWNFGESGSLYYDAIENAIRLRYRLLPYIYSIASEVVFDNSVMMRSLLFDFPDDKTAAEISDQFMFGKNLLVCPVVEPFMYGPKNTVLNKQFIRRCWLPDGVVWHDFWTGEVYNGGQWINTYVPIDKIPIFVRSGSILPMEKVGLEYASQITDEPMEIKIYPGSNGEFILYEDSGDGYGYEEGKYNRICFRWNDKSETLSISQSEYRFHQGLAGRHCIISVGELIKEIIYNGDKTVVEMGD